MSVLKNNLNRVKEKIVTCTDLTQQILGIVSETPSITEYLLYSLPQEKSFSGGTDYFDTEVAQSALVSGYTIIIRVKPNSWDQYRGIIGSFYSQGSYAPSGLWGLQHVIGKLEYCHYNGAEYTKINISTELVPVNQWTILCLTYDGGSHACIYCGDELITQTDTFNPLIAASNVHIGRCCGNTGTSDGRYFAGSVSHCEIYNKCLTQDEIAQAISNITG